MKESGDQWLTHHALSLKLKDATSKSKKKRWQSRGAVKNSQDISSGAGLR